MNLDLHCIIKINNAMLHISNKSCVRLYACNGNITHSESLSFTLPVSHLATVVGLQCYFTNIASCCLLYLTELHPKALCLVKCRKGSRSINKLNMCCQIRNDMEIPFQKTSILLFTATGKAVFQCNLPGEALQASLTDQ